jgi:CDP-glucose 4,6-dehydratase
MVDDPGLAGESFNFSTETPLSVLDLVGRIQAAAGSDLPLDVRGGAAHEIPAQHLSAEKARKVLGWEPTRTVDEALVETVDWYRTELSS